MSYDAIVVGAGPAGTAAAYDLQTAGARTLLLDRRRFPRDKPCAGGLTVKTLRRLRYSVTPVVREVCSRLVVGNGLHSSTTLRGRHPICAMTVRREFDEFCLQRTLEQGVTFRVVPHINSVEETASAIRLDTTAGVFHARYLVGADGANSVVRRFMPQAKPLTRGFAIEADVGVPGLPMSIDFGVIDFGYGWIFPKGDHASVGLYTASPTVRPGHAELAAYAAAKVGGAPLQRVVGHAIGLKGWEDVVATRRIALTGDAAGLVDPLLGEGIYNAVASGQAAATAILAALSADESLTQSFPRELRPVLANARAAYRAAVHFYQRPGFGYLVLTNPLISYGLMSGYARGLSFNAIKQRFLFFPLISFEPLQLN